MRAHRIPVVVAAALLLWLAPPSVSAQPEPGFKVIVHPDNPVGALDVAFLRDAYLKKTAAWGNGKTIRPIDLPASAAVRQRFLSRVLKKTPTQLRLYWNRKVFSGKGVPPAEVDNVAAAVAYVEGNLGAVAYLPIDAETGHAKVIIIR